MTKNIPWTSILLFLYLSWIGEGFAYEMFWWWDLMLHTWAGWLIMRWGMLTFPPENNWDTLLISSLVVNTLVSWELLEWFADTYFSFNMQKDGIKDTMEDILVGKLGVACYYIQYTIMRKYNETYRLPTSTGLTQRMWP